MEHARLDLVAPDRIWVGPLTVFDGIGFGSIEPPYPADAVEPRIVSSALAGNGVMWLVIADLGAESDPPCPESDGARDCRGQSLGLYAVQPEVAMTSG